MTMSRIISGTTANTDAARSRCPRRCRRARSGSPSAGSSPARRSAPRARRRRCPAARPARVRAHGERRHPVAAPHERVLLPELEARELAERHHAPAGDRHLQRAQRRHGRALLVDGARDDVHQIDVVAHLRHRRAGDRRVQHRGDRRGADADLPRLVLVDPELELARRLHPVEVDVPRLGIRRDDLREALRDLRHLVLVRSAHAVLHRPADGRSELERRDAPDHVGKLLGEQLLQAVVDALSLLEALGDDHQLREERVRELHVERQVEADRAAADVGAPVVDVLVLGERRLEPLRGRPRRRRSRRSAAGSGRRRARAGRRRERTAPGRTAAGRAPPRTRRSSPRSSATSRASRR